MDTCLVQRQHPAFYPYLPRLLEVGIIKGAGGYRTGLDQLGAIAQVIQDAAAGLNPEMGRRLMQWLSRCSFMVGVAIFTNNVEVKPSATSLSRIVGL